MRRTLKKCFELPCMSITVVTLEMYRMNGAF